MYFNVVTDWSKIYTTSVCISSSLFIHRLSWFNLPTGWKRFSFRVVVKIFLFLCLFQALRVAQLMMLSLTRTSSRSVRCAHVHVVVFLLQSKRKLFYFILYSFESWPSLTFLICKLCIKSVVWFCLAEGSLIPAVCYPRVCRGFRKQIQSGAE